MILLASQSVGRLSTLRAAGVDPLVRVSHVDEDTVLEELRTTSQGRAHPSPAAQVQALAQAKAIEVAARTLPQEAQVVVGCDSMLEIDGAVVGKPADAHVARDRWRSMRGRSGVIHTGHFLVRTCDGATAGAVGSALVRFGCPTDQEIDAYVASGEPLDCAGAFTIDGLGGAFIDSVEGDPHAVVGISLPLLRRLLAGLGVTWTDLWERQAAQG
ncbi:septum formation inhibitor Maf [Actinomyces lilanjuaniae]|uniref:Nucleoside triphosphate pyrophosphatase n=1 Tax=Actinomyces lilanjuaniae TaxID=2321394 RepID=A0ABN5PU93_9ACTO|nr:nucleoside triphosphate pyrophosphatase [Actinomyces lilanjuaniae]AYD90962.1 septum formation inhibitor Maf [Actinomyces lilanjuaniae]